MAGPLAASYTLPADILIDYLEDFMLFSFVNNLCQEASVPVPQDITLFAYNDLTYWAYQHLPAQHQEDLTSYLDAPPANAAEARTANLPFAQCPSSLRQRRRSCLPLDCWKNGEAQSGQRFALCSGSCCGMT